MSEFTIEAQNADSVTTCLDSVKQADIYVLILGGRYGWQPQNAESITELEYKTALSNGLTILVFNTTYPKENLQKQFEATVETAYFRKTVSDAFELQEELEKSLKSEIDRKQNLYFNNTEKVYSNLVKVEFPQYIYISDLAINKKEIAAFNKRRRYIMKGKSLHDFAVSALHMNNVSFPHDWVLYGKSVLTFHNLEDPNLPLNTILNPSTTRRLAIDEICSSDDGLSSFKYLLKKCLEAKLHKLKIKWIAEEGLFAFIPIQKDDQGRWLPRSIEWSKTVKRATRKVVEIKKNLKNKDEVFNIKCLSFRVRFERLNEE